MLCKLEVRSALQNLPLLLGTFNEVILKILKIVLEKIFSSYIVMGIDTGCNGGRNGVRNCGRNCGCNCGCNCGRNGGLFI